MKGYKGFEKGLVCRGKQYAENTVFKEDKAVICEKGMHFCKNPFDVLEYYPLINDECELNEFVEVEALDDAKTDDDKKFCTTKLKIGAKLSLKGFIEACVGFVIENTKHETKNDIASSQLAASGESSQLAASGESSQLAASGDSSKLAASGDSSKLAASGYYSQLAASGESSQLAASGDSSKLAASGDSSKLAASGYYSQLAASGESSQLAASGDSSKLAASGNSSQLAASGNSSKLAASGYYSQLAASGNSSKLAASGKHSVVAGIGINNIAKAVKGCWITLAEWRFNSEEDKYIPVCVKTEYVDGERIKENTFYKLENYEFVEVNNI